MTRTMVSFLLCVPVAVLAGDTPSAPLPAKKAAKEAILPDGFQMTVFAAETDVTQPISFTIDHRGRLWVVEATNYGEWKPTGKDRVVILQERDGKLTRTVFYEGFNYATGIEVGFGGVYVMSPPCLYFIPDRDGDDKPDGPPEVLFDGFGYKESRHNLANGFTWGPDGWLYGGHGRTSPSDVGRPGTPPAKRIHCDGGVYRIHPTRLVFENFADGTTNPWGVDFDDLGACFVSNCVNPHLFHMIPGGHYEPWRNRSSSQYAYERLPTIADHLHYVTGPNIRSTLGTPDTLALGGGHAHCGMLIYLGDSFPNQFRNAALMCNIHGRRINHDILKAKGSGYIASHGRDFMVAADPWFMGVTLRTGPDGSVFVSDWSDTGECHTYKPNTATGRIYKISYGEGKAIPAKDLSRLSDKELVELQMYKNDYYVRHARRILQERATKPGWKGEATHKLLREILESERAAPLRLRALWALHVTGGLTPKMISDYLEDSGRHLYDSPVVAWAVRILCESDPPDSSLSNLVLLAKDYSSPVVRLSLASSLQRLPLDQRWLIAEFLVGHPEDATDANLPLMYWYAIEPLVPADPTRALELALHAKIPLVRRFIARRLADEAAARGNTFDLAPLVAALAKANEVVRIDLLAGAREGLRGRKSLKMPTGWPSVYAKLRDGATRDDAIALALIFGDPKAVADLRKVVQNVAAPSSERNAAIQALLEKRVPDLAPLLHEQLKDRATRQAALRGLSAYSHPDTPKRILAVYVQLAPEEKQDAIAALASRKEDALALLDAVEKKQVPRADVSAFIARQIFALGDTKLNDRLKNVWGEVRPPSADKTKLMAKYRAILTPAAIKSANPANGRLVFSRTCQQCHKLYGEGGAIGPDLTGSNRTNLEYILANVIEPSAEVGRDYRMSVVRTADDRVITGIIVERTAARVIVQTATDRLTLSPDDIASVKDSPLSIMPEGQLDTLTREQIRDLMAYLTSKTQVASPGKK